MEPHAVLGARTSQVDKPADYEDYHRMHALPFDFPQTGFGAQPLQGAMVRGVRNSLLILVGAVTFVLLIACAMSPIYCWPGRPHASAK